MQNITDQDTIADPLALTLDEYADIAREIEEQPAWRHVADKEADYADGNQLDSELLKKQQDLGIPPGVEDLVGPAIRAIQGYESTTRTDWRVTPSGAPDGQDVADALNYRLNEAERESKADRACSDAFKSQITVGLGWAEVSRNSDLFGYPYRCTAVHRNEIHWDFKAREPDLSDARYLRRQRWMDAKRLAGVFPQHKDLIQACGTHGSSWWMDSALMLEGGNSTGLQNAWNEARSRTVQEDRWYNQTNKDLCLAEVWYRRWVTVPVLVAPNGRVVEYDENNEAHLFAVSSGVVRVSQTTVARVRRSYWLGPYCLFDGPTPYAHRHFPYVPFWGFREDATGVPYGYVRSMVYQQDALNSGISKLRWGMSVVRTERTKGAVAMTDSQFRKAVARADADIILDADHMAKPGSRFDVKRDYTLSEQHYKMLQDSRAAIERVSSVAAGFVGRNSTARSGIQEQMQVEQSNQSLGAMMDNFRAARSMVGDLLLSMIIEDLGDKQTVVVIEGDAVRPDKTVILNKPETDPETRIAYLSNDLQRTRLKVALEDVPSTNSYRGQQLNALSEAIKSMPAQYQVAVLPFMVSLMDVPFKRDVIEAVRAAGSQESPEAIEQRIKQAVQDALVKAGNDLKARELDLKERKTDAEIRKIVAEAVQVGVQSAFSAMQGGAQIAQMPQIAPIADAIMQSSGYQRPTPAGDDPNFPGPAQIPDGSSQEASLTPPVHRNTSPEFPPIPSKGESSMSGIETASTADNLQ